MTPDEPTPCPETTTRDGAPDFEPAASGFDAGELHGEADRDEAGWRIHGPLDDDDASERYDDDRHDDDWADRGWDRFDGYESLHLRHAPHDWPILDQPTEPPTDDEAHDEIEAAELEAEAAEPDAFRWFRQDADESA